MQEYEEKFYDTHRDRIDNLYSMLKEWSNYNIERSHLMDLLNWENFFDLCVKHSELYVLEYEEMDGNDDSEMYDEEYIQPELIIKKIEKPVVEMVVKQKPKWVVLGKSKL